MQVGERETRLGVLLGQLKVLLSMESLHGLHVQKRMRRAKGKDGWVESRTAEAFARFSTA